MQGVSPGGKDEGAQGVTAAPGVPNSSQILRHASVNSSNVFSGASVQPPSASIMLGTAQVSQADSRIAEVSDICVVIVVLAASVHWYILHDCRACSSLHDNHESIAQPAHKI